LQQDETDDELTDRLKRIAINQCCALIYTSGTTGPPKVSTMANVIKLFTAVS
jgi:long-subunit acyl-CoA synthetase (AMP-forming)